VQELNGEQWQKGFEQWIDALPDLPVFPDKALSRENVLQAKKGERFLDQPAPFAGRLA
jgi:hypothetical protein